MSRFTSRSGGIWPRFVVDLALRLGAHRLVRRERVDGEETRRMAGQAVDRHHADPIIDGIRRPSDRCSRDEPMPKGEDVPQSAWAEESQKLAVLWPTLMPGVVPRDLVEPSRDVIQVRRPQSRPGEKHAQRVDVIAERAPAHQGRLYRRRSAPHERIVNGVPRARQPLDEEFGKLRLEASPVAHLMDRMGLALTRGPELVDEIGNCAFDAFRPSPSRNLENRE